MNPILCSFLISSRHRPALLRKTLASIANGARDKSCFEIIMRTCEDDPETADAARTLLHDTSIKPEQLTVLIEPVCEHKDAVNYMELAKHAEGNWSWILGDDCEFEQGWSGDPWTNKRVFDASTPTWDDEMRKVPLDGFTIEPEFTGLNLSTYVRVPSGPFPCCPTKVLREMPFSPPIDRHIEDQLHGKLGWKPYFLAGIKLQHNNDAAKAADVAWKDQDANERLVDKILATPEPTGRKHPVHFSLRTEASTKAFLESYARTHSLNGLGAALDRLVETLP